MGYRTFSTDPILPNVTDPAGHDLERWIDGSVKSKHYVHITGLGRGEEANSEEYYGSCG